LPPKSLETARTGKRHAAAGTLIHLEPSAVSPPPDLRAFERDPDASFLVLS
jgi:hypothetical protein